MNALEKIKNTFFHILAEIFGVTKGAWNAVEPILASDIGPFLGAAVPVAETILLEFLENSANGGHGLTDDQRTAASSQLESVLIGQGIKVGVDLTQGLLKYAVDTAYHSQKVKALPPTPAAPGATGTNIIPMPVPPVIVAPPLAASA